jgi:predicted nucleic acid-binding protein
MAPRTECYVDTSALIAFLDRSDRYHSFFGRLFAAPPPLVTSGLVVAEGHNWFLRRYDQHMAIQFLALIEELPMLQVLPFGPEDLPGVGRLIRKFADQKLALADAHGLVIMRDRHINTCWSTDRHLALTGATLVI